MALTPICSWCDLLMFDDQATKRVHGGIRVHSAHTRAPKKRRFMDNEEVLDDTYDAKKACPICFLTICDCIRESQ